MSEFTKSELMAVFMAAKEFEATIEFEDWTDSPEIGIKFKKLQDALESATK